ncbi:AAA family ATPase [Brachyspira pilosicoli]|uniref:AAA family ATPase n=1 Tax=Brachyspira pilosicoli TaxID=52584 RepID=UPI003004F985
MRYWVFKHGNDDYAEEIINKALENNFCMCQYEYRTYDEITNGDKTFQDPATVTRIWHLLKEIKEGDIIILGAYGNSYKYSWGYAIKPRFENNLEKVQLNCEEVINTRHNNFKYRSDNYNGYIEFEDCQCFYENLEDGESGWGQRIDIDKWRDIERESIEYTHEYKLALDTIQEISKEDALNIVRALKNEPHFEFKENIMEDYKKLLENNYNLILTGAPGTGKTYLAKQIAAKIIFDDDKKEYTESLEEDDNFKNQCKFVQFHPSYDYTDFVEGLRPIKDSGGNIGFERKNGVFKEFCRMALKNLINSQKDISELNEDAIIKNNLLKFIEDVSSVIDEKGHFKIEGINRKAAPLKEIELNDETLYFVPDIKADKPIKLTLDKLVEFYKKFSEKLKINEKWEYQNFIDEFGLKGKHTYIYGFLNALYEEYNSEIEKELNYNNTVEKVEKKSFVFIIDEINRGEISKIFGELFFAIDPGYRGVKGRVLTQYSNLIDEELEKYFYIPENVYIIGTMNDIDRSVESMDFAMRRRFAWKEVKAIDTQYILDTMFNDNKEIEEKDKQLFIDEAKKRMDNLNDAIEKIDGFNSSYHIGASYFLKLKNYYKSSSDDKETAFKSLWENHLNGLLFEYLRGMPDASAKLEDLEDVYDGLIDEEDDDKK